VLHGRDTSVHSLHNRVHTDFDLVHNRSIYSNPVGLPNLRPGSLFTSSIVTDYIFIVKHSKALNLNSLLRRAGASGADYTWR
jgi:hypothetical protein